MSPAVKARRLAARDAAISRAVDAWIAGQNHLALANLNAAARHQRALGTRTNVQGD